MKALVLYKPNSEESRKVETYANDFERTQHRHLELVNLNTREGAATASLYDMMQSPSLLVLRDDGQLVKYWQGTSLPLMNEVASYIAS